MKLINAMELEFLRTAPLTPDTLNSILLIIADS